MNSYDVLFEAVKSIMEAMGFVSAFWALVIVVTVTSLWDMYQAHKFRKTLPAKIAEEILKVTSEA